MNYPKNLKLLQNEHFNIFELLSGLFDDPIKTWSFNCRNRLTAEKYVSNIKRSLSRPDQRDFGLMCKDFYLRAPVLLHSLID